jgi:LCP family protein required for cell wall assembly
MALEDKPYRVYRGGRVKGKVPTVPRPERKQPRRGRNGRPPDRYPGPGPAPRKRRWPRKRWLTLIPIVLIVLFVVWGVTSYLAVQSGIQVANKRLPKSAVRALTPQQGSVLSDPTYVLLLGTDHSTAAARAGDNHTDSIQVIRTDPGRNRISYLSIPRDLRVNIPGNGYAKVNAAYQIGGAALAIRTIQGLGIPVNHVAVIDLSRFPALIDAVGGVDINVPRPILSKFDCPYGSNARCARWPGWHFAKGVQHMNGKRARIYSRVRKNLLNPADTDISRSARQQQVMTALTHKMTSFGTLLRMPWIGGEFAKPLATDLSTNDFIELGWRKFRAGSNALYCRIGGQPSFGYLLPEGDDLAHVLREFSGKDAPQPPPPGTLYGSGCVVGHPLLPGA